MDDADLALLATGRTRPLFTEDVAASEPALRERIAGRRLLVIGGAGSIGSATVKELLAFSPRAVHIVDLNENELTEVVRDLRGCGGRLDGVELRTLPLDFGGSILRRFVFDEPPYDLVLNFAAVKHVRSEKDAYSLLHMLDTNVRKHALLLSWLAERSPSIEVFSVSTDKAADPVNAMGASKRLMEHVLFSDAVAGRSGRVVRSARFANVAFSNGSLPAGWLLRVQKRQPLPAPVDTRRYFVSLREAGQLCLLAGVLGQDGHIVIPRLDPAQHQRELVPMAHDFLAGLSLEGRDYTDEEEAIASVERDLRAGRYPVLCTPLDTMGEKDHEEFVGQDEVAVEVGWKNLRAVPYAVDRTAALRGFLASLEEWLRDPSQPVDKAALIEAMGAVVPEFAHRETGRSLDQRL